MPLQAASSTSCGERERANVSANVHCRASKIAIPGLLLRLFTVLLSEGELTVVRLVDRMVVLNLRLQRLHGLIQHRRRCRLFRQRVAFRLCEPQRNVEVNQQASQTLNINAKRRTFSWLSSC